MSSGSHREEENQNSKQLGREGAWQPGPGWPCDLSSSARESRVPSHPDPGASGRHGGLSSCMPGPGLSGGCSASWASAWGPQCPGLGRERGLCPRLSPSNTGGGSQGSGAILWVWPVTQQLWYFQATVCTARCGGCFPRDRRLLAPLCSWPGQPPPPASPLRPDHASGLDFCRLLCGGREGRHRGWSGELGLDLLAPTPEASTVHSGAGCSELQGCPRSPGPPRIFSSVSHLNQHWPGTAP